MLLDGSSVHLGYCHALTLCFWMVSQYTWDTIMLSLDAFGWFLSSLGYCRALALCFCMVPQYAWDTVML